MLRAVYRFPFTLDHYNLDDDLDGDRDEYVDDDMEEESGYNFDVLVVEGLRAMW